MVAMSIARHFMFLEFTNPEVLSLLTSLRDTLHGAPQRDPVHITVRGPYKEAPGQHAVEAQARALEGNFVMLRDVGTFETNKGHVVFLNAYSKIFDEIWWKPDYRDQRKRPHLTLLETVDHREAREAKKFLESEKLEIVTSFLSLTVYTSRQRSLWRDQQAVRANKCLSPMERVLVSDGIVSRAVQLKKYLNDSSASLAHQMALI